MRQKVATWLVEGGALYQRILENKKDAHQTYGHPSQGYKIHTYSTYQEGEGTIKRIHVYTNTPTNQIRGLIWQGVIYDYILSRLNVMDYDLQDQEYQTKFLFKNLF